jgi:predicted nucleic acid-binding protein
MYSAILKSIDNLRFAERIALTNNAILLTRNESDFGRIVELKIEDWAPVE